MPRRTEAQGEELAVELLDHGLELLEEAHALVELLVLFVPQVHGQRDAGHRQRLALEGEGELFFPAGDAEGARVRQLADAHARPGFVRGGGRAPNDACLLLAGGEGDAPLQHEHHALAAQGALTLQHLALEPEPQQELAPEEAALLDGIQELHGHSASRAKAGEPV